MFRAAFAYQQRSARRPADHRPGPVVELRPHAHCAPAGIYLKGMRPGRQVMGEIRPGPQAGCAEQHGEE